jgi:putative ABC transport system permease protein
VSSFLDAYRDLIWGARYLLSPAILVTLALVISNSISISVRERRKEMAVLKVLGFQPRHILGLVLGEALLIGTASGLLSAGGSTYFINNVMGGLKLPIAFFQAFTIPPEAIGWGAAVGFGTALVGSIIPAFSARRVKVSDVFSKVA